MATKTKREEISQKESEEIIQILVRKCNDDIKRCNESFQEMREQGEQVGPFLTSHITDSEDEKRGVQFCKGKTIRELKAFLENEPVLQESPVDKSLQGEAFEKALVNDPAYRQGWVRRGIEKYIEEAEKLL